MDWNNFFISTAGAAAALTGLIFVGVSISLARILSLPTLPNRALISLILLLTILISSIFFLVPRQSCAILGTEILITGAFVWISITRMDLSNIKKKEKKYKALYLFNVVMNQVSVLPYIVCGLVLLTSGENGIYWMVPAVILSFIKSVTDAWVLLVEINR